MKQNSNSRRSFLSASAAAVVMGPLSYIPKAFSQQSTSGTIESLTVVEVQIGDPLGPKENISFDPYNIQKFSAGQKASFLARKSDFGRNILQVADYYVGKDRNNGQAEISGFLNAFGLPFVDSKGKHVPFCAAAISYISILAYLGISPDKAKTVTNAEVRSAMPDIDHHHFYPTPSVLDMYHVAAGKRRWISRNESSRVRPGSLVIFDWEKNGGADHVGIVKQIDGNIVQTIEFNTSITINGSKKDGGQIAYKNRKLDETVKGFVLTHLITAI